MSEDKEVYTFPKGTSIKVNVIVQLEFKIAYYDDTYHETPCLLGDDLPFCKVLELNNLLSLKWKIGLKKSFIKHVYMVDIFLFKFLFFFLYMDWSVVNVPDYLRRIGRKLMKEMFAFKEREKKNKKTKQIL